MYNRIISILYYYTPVEKIGGNESYDSSDQSAAQQIETELSDQGDPSEAVVMLRIVQRLNRLRITAVDDCSVLQGTDKGPAFLLRFLDTGDLPVIIDADQILFIVKSILLCRFSPLVHQTLAVHGINLVPTRAFLEEISGSRHGGEHIALGLLLSQKSVQTSDGPDQLADRSVGVWIHAFLPLASAHGQFLLHPFGQSP